MSHPSHVRALCASLCLGAGLPVHAGHVHAGQGFLEDAKASLTVRNFHLHRNFVGDASQGKAEEWTQSFILDARSGFTQGSVGFGLDVLGLYSLKLDGGKERPAPNCCRSTTTAARPTTSDAWRWPASCASRTAN